MQRTQIKLTELSTSLIDRALQCHAPSVFNLSELKTDIGKKLSPAALESGEAKAPAAPPLAETTRPADDSKKEEKLNSNISIGDLEFGEKVAGGAFGIVYKGTWRGRQVAIKQPRNQKHVEAFIAEGKVMEGIQKLNLPSNVEYIGMMVCSDSLNIFCNLVMEYMPYGTVDDYILRSTDKPSEYKSACYKYSENAAAAFAKLHDRNYIHGDPKWSNLMLQPFGGVKITDFGYSFPLPPGEADKKIVVPIGTAGYRAPEVIQNKIYGKKADVFAFGTMMYVFLTKDEPWPGIPRPKVNELVQNGKRPTIPRSCPKEYAKLMGQCWDQDPNKRPTFWEIHAKFRELNNQGKQLKSRPPGLQLGT